MTKTPKLAALKMSPLPHQERVADQLGEQPGLIAYHGLGTGKTFTAINAAEKHQLPLLAITPASLRNNMRKEIENSGLSQPFKVLSYDEARRRLDDPDFKNFAENSLVAYDESHRMGRAESLRSELATKVPGQKKLFLTGTPMRNAPHEIAPMVNAIAPGTLPDTPEDFAAEYTPTREVPVGFWGRLRGVKPGREVTPVNIHEFEKKVGPLVDYHEAVDRSDFPSYSESIVEVPMSDRQQDTYDFTLGQYPQLAYKVRHGLPLNRAETKSFRAFLSGPRQVSNHPGSYNASATDEDAVKIRKAADEIQERFKTDPHFRGVSYSAFLETGIRPLSRELERRGIPYRVFTGEQKDKERQKIIEDYNTGQAPVLLISGAGAEGLDLKGTRLMQMLEPHWQEEQMNQVRGRGIRYKSHSHLPEDMRHVEVQRFHSVPKAGLMDRIMRRTRSTQQSIDEYLYQKAQEKRQLNETFLNPLRKQTKTSAAEDEGFWHEWRPDPDMKMPAFLFDLDGTLVQTTGEPKEQFVMPNRLKVLMQLREKGYPLIGVTNRTDELGKTTLSEVIDSIAEVDALFHNLLDDILFIPFATSLLQKPSPTMIYTAIERFALDPDNIVFVGDSDVDQQAAEAAGVDFAPASLFFTNLDIGLLPPAKARFIASAPEGWVEEEGKLVREFFFEDIRKAKDFITALNQRVSLGATPPIETELSEGKILRVVLSTLEPEPHVSYDDRGFAHWLTCLYDWNKYDAWGEEYEDAATRGATRKPRHFTPDAPNPEIVIPSPSPKAKDLREATDRQFRAGVVTLQEMERSEPKPRKHHRLVQTPYVQGGRRW